MVTRAGRDVSPWFAVGILLAAALMAGAMLFPPKADEPEDVLRHIREEGL